MRLILAVLLGACQLVACQRALQAEDPVWNKQACDHCKMLLSDPSYAAQLVAADGQRLFFDDVGCLARAMAELKAPARAAWVHDADGNGWLAADAARYRSGASTPMDSGFSAHTTAPGVDFQTMTRAVLTPGDAHAASGK